VCGQGNGAHACPRGVRLSLIPAGLCSFAGVRVGAAKSVTDTETQRFASGAVPNMLVWPWVRLHGSDLRNPANTPSGCLKCWFGVFPAFAPGTTGDSFPVRPGLWWAAGRVNWVVGRFVLSWVYLPTLMCDSLLNAQEPPPTL